MITQRQKRVNSLLKHELSDIIRREMEDPNLGFLTVTDVEVSADLRHAKVYVSVLGTEQQAEGTIRALTHASGFIRAHLAHRLDLRRIPQMQFRLDTTASHAQRIEELLRQTRSTLGDDGER